MRTYSNTSRARYAAWVLGFVIVALLLAPTVKAQPSAQVGSATEGISVVGTGTVVAPPDVAHVTLGVEVFDPSLTTAQDTARNRMSAVLQRLREAGIPESDIRTTSYNVSPEYSSPDQQGAPALRGYRVQNLVEVRSSDIAGLGALIDAAVNAGATRVHGTRFESSNLEQLGRQAREQAFRDARSKAEHLAQLSGTSLGRLQLIEDLDPRDGVPVRIQPAAQAAPGTPIEPGIVEVRSMVHVVWLMQPAGGA